MAGMVSPAHFAMFTNDDQVYTGPHSLQDLQNDLQRSAGDSDLFPTTQGGLPQYPYVRDIIVPPQGSQEWFAIVQAGSKTWKARFRIGRDGEPEFTGEAPQEIEVDQVYVPVTAPETNPIPAQVENSFLSESAYTAPVAASKKSKSKLSEKEAFANCGSGMSKAVWAKAKEAVGKTYSEQDDEFWPEVQSVARKMSGS